MKLYIAGKITGDPHYRRKFAAIKQVLKSEGHTVLNPAVLPEGLLPADYMRICFAMIDIADAVIFLPDYSLSGGAKLEYEYSHYVRKLIFFLEGTTEWAKARKYIEREATQ